MQLETKNVRRPAYNLSFFHSVNIIIRIFVLTVTRMKRFYSIAWREEGRLFLGRGDPSAFCLARPRVAMRTIAI